MEARDNNHEERFSDPAPLPYEPASEELPAPESKEPSPAQLLLQMAEDQYRLLRSTDGRTYAVPKMGPSIAVPLASKSGGSLRAKLAASLRRRTGKVASGSQLADAINVLEGEADPDLLVVGKYYHLGFDIGIYRGRFIGNRWKETGLDGEEYEHGEWFKFEVAETGAKDVGMASARLGRDDFEPEALPLSGETEYPIKLIPADDDEIEKVFEELRRKHFYWERKKRPEGFF